MASTTSSDFANPEVGPAERCSPIAVGSAAGGPGFGTIEVPRASAHRFADGTGYAALTWQLAVSASDFPPLGSSTVTAIVPSDGVRVVGNQGRPCRTTIRSPS